MDVPREAPGLQMVGDGDICAPDIKLPLAEPQHSAQHAAGVDTCTSDSDLRTRSDKLGKCGVIKIN